MYLKVVSLHTFTSLDFCNSLVHNDSTDFADNFLFCGDLISSGSYVKLNVFYIFNKYKWGQSL